MPFLARQINCKDKGTRRLLILGNINSEATRIDISGDLITDKKTPH